MTTITKIKSKFISFILKPVYFCAPDEEAVSWQCLM